MAAGVGELGDIVGGADVSALEAAADEVSSGAALQKCFTALMTSDSDRVAQLLTSRVDSLRQTGKRRKNTIMLIVNP